ncbi:MAG: carboxypeptidase-like regulatory domain-containing protein [Methylococcaceae bacterium]|nr:carboxypeptidase-like regulatory domain-containing protein [Prolixibacteraceae bacterium]
MKNYQLILLLILLFGAFQLKAQEDEIDPMPIRLKGQVLNLDDETPVAYASVTNYRTHSRVTTNEQGFFTVDALNIDSLEVSSLGFTKTVFHIPANYNEMNVLIVYAKPVRFALPQVNVKGEKQKVNMDGVPVGKKLNIDPQLRGDVYQKKPSVLAAIFSPASFLQYYTSKREKEKRETRQAIVTEKKWESLSQYYNKELVMELTGLSEFQVDSFMIYFNSKGILAQLQTEYDVRNAIIEVYKQYKQEGH